MKKSLKLFFNILFVLVGCSKSDGNKNNNFLILGSKNAIVNGQNRNEEQWVQLLRQIVNTGELAHSSITVDKSVRSEVLYDIFIRLGECGINECQIHLNETNISCTFSTGDSGKFPELKSLDKISMSRILDGASSELKFYEKFNTVVVKLSEPLSPIETEKLNLANQNRNPKFMPIVLCDKNVEATLVLKELALIESLSTRPVLFIVKNRGYDYK